MERTEWKIIDKYDGQYAISKNGEVRSLLSGKLLAPSPDKNGYPAVSIKDSNGVSHHVWIHRLLAESFIPNPEQKKTVNHKDGNKLNYDLSNLEWATHSENIKHAYDNSLMSQIDENGKSIPNRVPVRRNDGVVFRSMSEAARCSGCSCTSVRRVLLNKMGSVNGYTFSLASRQYSDSDSENENWKTIVRTLSNDSIDLLAKILVAIDEVGSIEGASRKLKFDRTTFHRRLNEYEKKTGLKFVERSIGRTCDAKLSDVGKLILDITNCGKAVRR